MVHGGITTIPIYFAWIWIISHFGGDGQTGACRFVRVVLVLHVTILTFSRSEILRLVATHAQLLSPCNPTETLFCSLIATPELRHYWHCRL
jgi:hypothetical protein